MASLPIVYACNLRFIHTKFSLVLVFTSPICTKKKNKKSPWFKVKKKTGPKKKKKEVFEDEWRKTLADSDKVIMGVTGLTQLLPKERYFCFGYFSHKLDSRVVVICLFDELRDSVFVYIPDKNNILRHTPATAFLPEAALLDR